MMTTDLDTSVPVRSTDAVTTTATPTLPALFHRVARAHPRHAPWRTIVGTAALVVGCLFTVVLFAGGGFLLSQSHTKLPAFGALTPVIVLVAGAPVLLALPLIVTRYLGVRRAGTVISVTGQPRWGWLLRCQGIAVLFVAGGIGGDLLLSWWSGNQPAPTGEVDPMAPALTDASWVSVSVLTVLLLVATVAGEVIHRGWLLQTVGSITRRPWVAVVVQAVPYASLYAVTGDVGSIALALGIGFVLGWLAIVTGGVEAGIAVHTTLTGASAGALAVLALWPGAQTVLVVQHSDGCGCWHIQASMLAAVGAYALFITWYSRRRAIANVYALNESATGI